MPNQHKAGQKKAPVRRLFFYSLLVVLALALALGSWLNPNHYAPWVVFENEASAFAGCLLSLLALLVRKRDLTLEPTYAAILSTAMIAVLLQYGVGMISWQSLSLGVLYLMALGSSIIVGHNLQTDSIALAEVLETKILAFVLLATIVSSGVVLGQWLHLEEYYPALMAEHGNFRPYGNLGQPNNQGTLLLTGIVCTELLLRKRALSRTVASISVLTLLPAIAATGSRTAILSAVTVAAYLLIVGRTRKFGFTAGWLIALLACFVVLPKLGIAAAPEIPRISAMLTDSPRLHIYGQLLWAIYDQPWTGYGWMQTAYAQSVAAAHVFGGVETDYAHNIVLDILVWFGLPLGVLLLLSCSFAVTSNWRRSEVKYKLAYALFVPFVLHSMLEFPFAYAFFLLPAGMLLGYLGRPAIAKDGGVAKSIEIGRKVGITLFALTTSLAMVVCVEYLELAEDFRILRFENQSIGTVPENFRPSSPTILRDLKFKLEMMRYTPHRSESVEKIEQIRQFVLRTHNPNAHVKLISQQILDGHFAEAYGEIHRFRNLYGKEVVDWGMNSLNAANCKDKAIQINKQAVCSALMER